MCVGAYYLFILYTKNFWIQAFYMLLILEFNKQYTRSNYRGFMANDVYTEKNVNLTKSLN